MASLAFLATWLAAGALPGAPHLTVAPSPVVYGDQAMLTVTVPAALSAQVVSVTETPLGGATRTLGSFGPGTSRWTMLVRPRLATTYRASSPDGASGSTVVTVRPKVRLVFGRGAFLASVAAARAYTGRWIFLQRLSHARWKTVRRGVLRRNPKRFHIALPPGRSTLRAYVPRSSAQPGYVAGFSKPVNVKLENRR